MINSKENPLKIKYKNYYSVIRIKGPKKSRRLFLEYVIRKSLLDRVMMMFQFNSDLGGPYLRRHDLSRHYYQMAEAIACHRLGLDNV